MTSASANMFCDRDSYELYVNAGSHVATQTAAIPAKAAASFSSSTSEKVTCKWVVVKEYHPWFVSRWIFNARKSLYCESLSKQEFTRLIEDRKSHVSEKTIQALDIDTKKNHDHLPISLTDTFVTHATAIVIFSTIFCIAKFFEAMSSSNAQNPNGIWERSWDGC